MPVLPHPTPLLGDKTLIIDIWYYSEFQKSLSPHPLPTEAVSMRGGGEITAKSQGGVGGKLASTSPQPRGSQPDKSGGKGCRPVPQKAGQLGRLRWVPGLLVSGRGTMPEVLGLGSSSAWPCGVTLGSAFSLFGSQNSFYPTPGPGELSDTRNTFRLLQYNVKEMPYCS